MNSTLDPAEDIYQRFDQRMTSLEMLAMRPVPAPDAVAMGQQFAKGVGDIVKSQGAKRSRSPDGAPEEPVAEVVDFRGTHDNHKVFCWEARRAYKNLNSKPEDYWAEAKYPLKATPNLRGNLYIDHLGWVHSATTQLEVKYFVPANRTNKRNKKEGLKITSKAGITA